MFKSSLNYLLASLGILLHLIIVVCEFEMLLIFLIIRWFTIYQYFLYCSNNYGDQVIAHSTDSEICNTEMDILFILLNNELKKWIVIKIFRCKWRNVLNFLTNILNRHKKPHFGSICQFLKRPKFQGIYGFPYTPDVKWV